MRLSHLALAAAIGIGLAAPSSAAEIWRATGFQVPESVTWDAANNRMIVSNINGDPTQADGNGYLSLVDADGTVSTAEWVKGLDAPKGAAILDGRLYVADITRLRVVDLASGEYETVEVPGAVFLNDVTAGDGAVYVSDTFGNSVYRYQDGKVEPFVADVPAPNGLLLDGQTLYVASMGQLAENQADNKPGGFYSVDLASKALTKDEAAGDFGFLDGIVKVDGTLYVSDFMAGKIHRMVPDAVPEELATLGMGSGDIGTDGENILVPMLMTGEVIKLGIGNK
jgi:sugar lactone lactonase YvrE